MAHPVPTLNGTDYPTRVAALIAALDRRLKGNILDNGAFQVWQRGTSFASGARAYTADRWEFYRNSSSANATASRQTGTTARYAMRLQRNNGNAVTDFIALTQTVETANSIPLAGRSITVSLKAKCGANYSASGSAFSIQVIYGTGTDQNVNTPFTGATTLINQSNVVSTTQADFTTTATMGAGATEFGVVIVWTPTGTAGVNDWLEIEEVQVVIGDYAGNFPYRSDIEELVNCRRYLPAIFAANTATPVGSGQCYLTTAAVIIVNFGIPARAAVTGVVVSSTGHFSLLKSDSTVIAATGIAWNRGGTHSCELTITGASGLTAGNGTNAIFNNASGYILFTGAEL